MTTGSRWLIRPDRFLTLSFFRTLNGLSGRSSDVKIPVLMYHSIARDVDDNVHPYFRTVTSPEIFENHMELLCQLDYEVLTLSDAVRLLQGMSDSPITRSNVAPHLLKSPVSGNRLHRKVVVTFDDGFRDFYTNAFPILNRFGFKATVFLTSGCIGNTFLTGRECLGTREIRELAEKGVEFGSHTITHPQLKECSRGKILHEVAGSKVAIENITGSEVSLFSYPYRFPEEDREFVRKLGILLVEQRYTAGVTTAIGLSKICDDPFFLRRLPMNDCDDGELFLAKLEGSYDWLHKVQLMYKKLRAMKRNLTVLCV